MKTPWSTLPICHGPAITPQRSITAGTPWLAGTPRSAARRRAWSRRRACARRQRELLGDPRRRGAREHSARRRARSGSPPRPGRAPAAARPGRRGWSRGRRGRRRRAAPARGSCRRRAGWSGRGRRCRRRPASTEGSAEHSTSAEISGRRSRSAGSRTSPWTNSTPASRGAAGSAPSRAGTGCRARRSPSRGARRARPPRFQPTKPAPPVIRTRVTIQASYRRSPQANRYPRPVPAEVALVGCGFIGSHVAAELTARGIRFGVLTRSHPLPDIAAAIEPEFLRIGDAADRATLEEALDGAPRSFTRPGEAPGGDRGEPRAEHRADPRAGRGAARRPPRGPGSRPHLHLIGRDRLRGARPGPVSEDAPTRPRALYGKLHLACEEAIGRAREEAGLGRGSCAARPSTASTSSPTGARARS